MKRHAKRNALAALLVTVHGPAAFAVAAERLLEAINQGECAAALAWSGVLEATVTLCHQPPEQ
jgi:hypothetical protein